MSRSFTLNKDATTVKKSVDDDDVNCVQNNLLCYLLEEIIKITPSTRSRSINKNIFKFDTLINEMFCECERPLELL